ncbi:hypothetical protein ACFQL0_21580 [Haloplanus litoreus]|uniref:hypothetical protein n=1 Tax=Haloplanus litoreus TaxID=767515 RepID=UPI00360ED9A0
MSSTETAETEEVDLSRAQIRAAYNPFEHGCWLDFANKITQGYMAAEHDAWNPSVSTTPSGSGTSPARQTSRAILPYCVTGTA